MIYENIISEMIKDNPEGISLLAAGLMIKLEEKRDEEVLKETNYFVNSLTKAAASCGIEHKSFLLTLAARLNDYVAVEKAF